MPGWSPIYQILAGRERHTWEEGEGRIHQIIGVTYAAERWVGIKSCQYRVVILMTLVDWHIESCIVAGILEVVELGILSLCSGSKHHRKR